MSDVAFLARGFGVPVALLLLLALLSQPTALVHCNSVLCSTWAWYLLDYN